mgnify:CR=1 FL=1
MTIKRMIELLQDQIEDGVCENTEVRLMTQEGYPFENEISGLACSTEISDPSMVDEPDQEFDEDLAYSPQREFRPDPKCHKAIYICEGNQLGYGTRRAWRVAKK